MFKIIVALVVFIAGKFSIVFQNILIKNYINLVTNAGSPNPYVPCLFYVNVPSIPAPKREKLVKWLNSNTFTSYLAYSESVTNAFFSDTFNSWFVQFLGWLAVNQLDLTTCSINGTGITFY